MDSEPLTIRKLKYNRYCWFHLQFQNWAEQNSSATEQNRYPVHMWTQQFIIIITELPHFISQVILYTLFVKKCTLFDLTCRKLILWFDLFKFCSEKIPVNSLSYFQYGFFRLPSRQNYKKMEFVIKHCFSWPCKEPQNVQIKIRLNWRHFNHRICILWLAGRLIPLAKKKHVFSWTHTWRTRTLSLWR